MARLTHLLLFLLYLVTSSVLAHPVSDISPDVYVTQRETKLDSHALISKITSRTPQFHSTADLLRYFYTDMTRLSEVADPNIVLHRWNDPKNDNPVVGRSAVQAHLEGFIAATGGTLFMDFKEISANEHFGSVMGWLRVGKPGGTVGEANGQVSVPFCGVWRFRNGKPIEHWENIGDGANKLTKWLELAARG